MKGIYKSAQGKNEVLALYDRQLRRLGLPFKDLFVETSFGKTHLVETGNLAGPPLLVFHGGNATTAYNLLACDFLLPDFHVYAVDTIGHPGKSDETCLSPRGYDYGRWAGEVITALGFQKMRCFGGSFGAGVLVKAMCAAPEKIERAVLHVPSGLNNAPAIRSVSMMFPMLLYWMTHKSRWLIRCLLPMAVTEENISDDFLETAKCSIDNVKIKAGMPSNVSPALLQQCPAPTLVMAGENDCLFPARRVLPRAESALPDCTPYLLQGRGHVHVLTPAEKTQIIRFLA